MRTPLASLMARAVEIARNGGRAVYPNPMVGAVICDDEGNILSEGWHRCCGGDHAEVDALKKLDRSATGLTMLVTLEPCNHFGRTPPCSHAIVAAGIKKVYIASHEPTEKACGGCDYLTSHGVAVEFVPGFEEELAELNRFFSATAKERRPWVTLKAATTADGFIAPPGGGRFAISSPEALVEGHRLRAGHMAIAVGAGTVNSDDPLLTVRLVEGPDPIPVIFSARLALKPDRRVLDRAPIIFTAVADRHRVALLAARGCRIETLTPGAGSIGRALSVLWERYRINSLLVEGGAALHTSFLAEGLVDEMVRFIAPLPLGEGIALAEPAEADRRFRLHAVSPCGADVMQVWRR
ncbi:MAG TPA: bifunctional diaminohydroxyphosphoribosylaminopyrimidine deaminase/5-amino-6-(5-phosphoribosylamino)uracil reductase RibD [bacterium]|nr:bifunctional diaminohydroxyphosphoribosylaminopyrimidine deaminase/5-amino-6-(5-phosphoribosylamino)uracil reductase RibD [bacterium]